MNENSNPPPERPDQQWGWDSWGRGWRRRSSVRGGIVLIVIGILLLLANLHLLDWLRWEIIWPLVLIAIGVWLVLRRR